MEGIKWAKVQFCSVFVFLGRLLKSSKKREVQETAAEVIDRVIEKMRIPEAEQEVTLKSGESKVRNQVRWARLYLAYAGYIDASKRGIWSLTEKGLSVDTLTFDAQEALNETNKRYAQGMRLKDRTKALVEEVDVEEIEMLDHRTSLLNLIKSLPPSGFERLSQRLLRSPVFKKWRLPGRLVTEG